MDHLLYLFWPFVFFTSDDRRAIVWTYLSDGSSMPIIQVHCKIFVRVLHIVIAFIVANIRDSDGDCAVR